MPLEVELSMVPMRHRDPLERRHNFEEVALGYSAAEAAAEAFRCILCAKSRPVCVRACPAGMDILGFIKAIQEDDLPRAAKVLKTFSSLPAVCGRVCPAEDRCEANCVLFDRKKGESVAIGALERYVADWELSHGIQTTDIAAPSGKKVAVAGSGPAGLTAAADLAKAGHEVVLYEALHIPGGVLVYGIPEFRLPKRIVAAEVDYIRSLGVEVKTDVLVGRTFTVDELLNDGFQAAFVATGAGLPYFLRVPGENLVGIYSANEFLTRVNLMKAYLFPDYDTPVIRGQRVAVIGGGNVAMDAARVALRLGAREVSIVYRRTEAEFPARKVEVENAKEEGIVFRTLAVPVRFLGNGHGQVTAMECQRMKLGRIDSSGRPAPIPQPDDRFTLEVDTAVLAIGTTPNPMILSTTPDLQVKKQGTLIANLNGRTSKARVWAGGDVVSGTATVISAIGAAKVAATDIDSFLRS